MGFVRTRIANCRTASVKKAPWIPIEEDEVVGEKCRGDPVDIDPDTFVYDWEGDLFYKIKDPDGWINKGCVEYEGGSQ